METFQPEQSKKPSQAINPAFYRLGIILFEIAQSEVDDSAHGGKAKEGLTGHIKKIKNGKRNEKKSKEEN